MHEFRTQCVLAALATWRVAHLLVSEDGPADVITRFRVRLGDSVWGKLMDCFGCVSLGVSMPIAILISSQILEFILTWPALSGAAFLLERATGKPLVLERSSEQTKQD